MKKIQKVKNKCLLWEIPITVHFPKDLKEIDFQVQLISINHHKMDKYTNLI